MNTEAEKIDPTVIADELRNQASPSAIQRDLFARAADTIDALVKERDLFKREQVRLAHRCDAAQKERDAGVKERDALVAVVEKVRGVIGAEIGWESPAILIGRIQWALSTAPADALAEHDARLIEKALNDLWTEIHVQRFAADSHAADIPGVVKTNVNTFYAGVIRARSMVDSARKTTP